MASSRSLPVKSVMGFTSSKSSCRPFSKNHRYDFSCTSIRLGSVTVRCLRKNFLLESEEDALNDFLIFSAFLSLSIKDLPREIPSFREYFGNGRGRPQG